MITTDDIQAYIAWAIQNNKEGVIQAMNSTGNAVASNISDAKLIEQVWNVFKNKGVAGLKDVLDRVPRDKKKITDKEAQAFITKFRNLPPEAKFGDWVKNIGDYFGDLLGGSAVQGGSVSQVTSESALSPTVMILIALTGLVSIILLRKVFIAVIGIIVVVVMIIAYGIFAKKITSVTTGGNTTVHNGIGDIVVDWVNGWLK